MQRKELTGYPSIDKPWLKYYSETEKRLNITYSEEYVNNDNCKSMYQSIYGSNATHLDYVALDYFGTKITYQELFDKINCVAGALLKYGIKQGGLCEHLSA